LNTKLAYPSFSPTLCVNFSEKEEILLEYNYTALSTLGHTVYEFDDKYKKKKQILRFAASKFKF
jgi:hypothetical protein